MVSVHPFRVSLADPHPIILEGLAGAFARSRRFEVVSRSTSSADALAHIRSTHPDLLVIDLRLPRDGGVGLLEEIGRASIRPRVLVFSESIATGALETAASLGIDGFISKRLSADEIVEEASRLIAFRTTSSPVVVGFDAPSRGAALCALSAREHNILALAARGLANKEIASELGITAGTVKVHLHAIYRKLGINRRTELTRFSGGTAKAIEPAIAS